MDKAILVVDDESDIRDILQFNLDNAGYFVECASSAEEALAVVGPQHCLILLDVMMSGMSGFQMARKLRESGNEIPIIFLTAKSAQDDLLTGFSSGGDDYIPKPFSIQEVLARVAAVLKRTAALPQQSEVTAPSTGDVRVDHQAKLVYVKGEPVAFSKKEFEILDLLSSNPGQIFSRETLIEKLWQEAPYVLDRTVDVHIARIRNKLGPCKNYITNRSGYGYIFNPVE